MKIKLEAFGNKLTGYMEVPENTTREFKLALAQSIQAFTSDVGNYNMMEESLLTVCTFSWTGMLEVLGDESSRIYVLTSIEKRS